MKSSRVPFAREGSITLATSLASTFTTWVVASPTKRHRPGMPSLRTQLARQLRNNMTVSERRLWSHLRGRKVEGWKFRRQAPIGNFIVDFVCPAAKLVIELDGFTHDDSKFDYDQRRQAWLESRGYKVLRFSSDFHNGQSFEGVIETIYFEIGQRQRVNPLPRQSEDDLI
jgi:very-short-patch-repair endonuclease